jgi:hypothetical protein
LKSTPNSTSYPPPPSLPQALTVRRKTGQLEYAVPGPKQIFASKRASHSQEVGLAVEELVKVEAHSQAQLAHGGRPQIRVTHPRNAGPPSPKLLILIAGDLSRSKSGLGWGRPPGISSPRSAPEPTSAQWLVNEVTKCAA